MPNKDEENGTLTKKELKKLQKEEKRRRKLEKKKQKKRSKSNNIKDKKPRKPLSLNFRKSRHVQREAAKPKMFRHARDDSTLFEHPRPDDTPENSDTEIQRKSSDESISMSTSSARSTYSSYSTYSTYSTYSAVTDTSAFTDGASPLPMVGGTGGPEKGGWLFKKNPGGIRGMKMWKKRFVILSTSIGLDGKPSLVYFKSKDDEQPKGKINIGDITAVGVPDKHKNDGRFNIFTERRVYAWKAANMESCQNWLEALEELIKPKPKPIEDETKEPSVDKLEIEKKKKQEAEDAHSHRLDLWKEHYRAKYGIVR